eukprot:1270663-Amphidinium_carterae.1
MPATTSIAVLDGLASYGDTCMKAHIKSTVFERILGSCSKLTVSCAINRQNELWVQRSCRID